VVHAVFCNFAEGEVARHIPWVWGNSPRVTADALERLGDTRYEAGHPDAAREAWTRALDIRNKLESESAGNVRDKLRGQ